MKCQICGSDTRKGRNICKGCHAVKEVAKKKEHAPKEVFATASAHLDSKPELAEVSWKAFFKKNRKTIV